MRRTTIPSSQPEFADIQFPGAAPIRVQFKGAIPDEAPAPFSPPTQSYAAMSASADAGNATQAYELYCAITACRMWTREEESLKSGKQLPPYDAQIMAKRRALGTFCGTVPKEQLKFSDAWVWLKKAADGGNLHAMRELTRLGPRTASSAAVLEAAWAKGALRPLWELGSMYQAGLFEGDVPNPDPVRSTAYKWLYVRLNEAAFSKHETPSDFVTAIDKVVEREMSTLPADDRARALVLAREILAANVNCCYVP